MIENTTVRDNLMNERYYTPYCGSNISRHVIGGCDNPRTAWNGKQFKCPKCGLETEFPDDFIERYKKQWNLS